MVTALIIPEAVSMDTGRGGSSGLTLIRSPQMCVEGESCELVSL